MPFTITILCTHVTLSSTGHYGHGEFNANIAYAIKENNGRKINSHLWAFNAIAEELNPKYVVLLDAGTVPSPTAILHLYADLQRDEHVGGCCGEIMVDQKGLSFWNFVVMAQVGDSSLID